MSKEPKTEDKTVVEPKTVEVTGPAPLTTPFPDQPAAPEDMVRALDFPSINEPPEPPGPKERHTLAELDPTEAAIGDPDVTLTVTGTGFIDGAQIVFNGGLEPTTFVSDTELTTIVKPSTAEVAVTVPVTVVQQGFTIDPPLSFTFTEAETRGGSKRRRTY